MPSTPTPTYDPAATYSVRLTRTVKVGAFTIDALHEHEMLGAFLIQLIEENGADAVATSERL